jgi:hypothetical protein
MWLQKGLEFGMLFYNYIDRNPMFEDIRQEPCFRDILNQMKILGDHQRLLVKTISIPGNDSGSVALTNILLS